MVILDACCGGRHFWFNKNHPNVVYQDIRIAPKGILKERPNFCVEPDVVGDFRDMKFPDKSFKLVVFDPPHLKQAGENSWLRKKYGVLDQDWKEQLTKGFNECWRVLDDYGTLIFKWNEDQVKHREVLDCFHIKPLFGHPTAKSGKTKWFCFMKIPKEELDT